MDLTTTQLEIVIFLASALALAYAAILTMLLLREDEGTPEMRAIASAIREGADRVPPP